MLYAYWWLSEISLKNVLAICVRPVIIEYKIAVFHTIRSHNVVDVTQNVQKVIKVDGKHLMNIFGSI